MSAIQHTSGLPTPSPSRSGAGINKGVFPPRPKSVRVWAVIDHAQSQESSDNPGEPQGPVTEIAAADQSGQASTGSPTRGLPVGVFLAVSLLVLVVLAVIVLARWL